MLESAGDYVEQLSSFWPRRSIAFSLRGCGKSDSPATGYSFRDHVSDVTTIIDGLIPKRFFLYGYSVGAVFALAHSVLSTHLPDGLIIGDFPAKYPYYPQGWAEYVIKNSSDKVSEAVVRAIQADSREVALWDELSKVQCPVLIMRGTKRNQRGASLLTDDEVKEYLDRLPDARTVALEGSGHDLWKPDLRRYIDTISKFLESIDVKRDQQPTRNSSV